ncbi:MAG: DNA alkylation repair protein [Tannerella sp.]|jgi:3-methyladenine DNA glycosylase AlkD|nr:DNA alkylation repair protein [Tannerella sp.]
MNASIILSELQSIGTKERAATLQRFFKTGKGQYGEGDVFIGVVVPQTRKVAKAHLQTPIAEIEKLLGSKYHEARLCALIILCERFKSSSEERREEIFKFYLDHISSVNNWDLVDLSCPVVLGGYLIDKERDVLYKLAVGNNIWERRISIVSTFAFIRNGDFDDTLKLSKILLMYRHDIIRKAVGWTLREIGKYDVKTLSSFLEEHAATMPRTSLRYAIEHYPEPERQYWLKRKKSLSSHIFGERVSD